MITRTQIIQGLIDKTGAKTYLELGIQDANNFNAIRCEHKVGVDPAGGFATHWMITDEFFKINQETFKICFVDASHDEAAVRSDILNCLKILEPGGYIVCHDMLPPHRDHQNPYMNGTCWRAFVGLRKERSDLEMYTVNEDHGCGIIRAGTQELLEVEQVTWEGYETNKKSWMNVISYQEFKEQFLK